MLCKFVIVNRSLLNFVYRSLDRSIDPKLFFYRGYGLNLLTLSQRVQKVSSMSLATANS
jgi:hypothetical protein